MSIPADQVLIAEVGLAAFAGKVPGHVRDKLQILYRRDKHSFILYEWRPYHRNPEEWIERGVAKFNYIQKLKIWKLYWMRADLKWHGYPPLPLAGDIEILFKEVEKDQCHCFWG